MEEIELTQQSYAKETKKKRKGIALKVNSSREEYKDSSNSEEDAKNFNLMVRKLGKFLRKSKDGKSSKTSKKIENNNSYTCFECGKHGHIKSKYSIYLRKHGEKRSKNDIKQKKCKQESQPTPTINKKQKAVKEPKNKEKKNSLSHGGKEVS